jgi:putative ABC transport system permease protein
MFANYLAAALRNLTRNGLYAGVTIAGLAIGFAAAILIGLYVRHELTYDQFVPGHERVYLMNVKLSGDIGQPVNSDSTSDLLADALKLQFPQIQYAARLTGTGFPPALRRGDVNVAEQGFIWADPDFFKVLPLPAVAGDPATALEAPDAVVLTRSAARKFFGQDAPIGGVLQVDGHPMRVAAVIEDLPSNSHLAGEAFGSSKAAFSAIKQFGNAGFLNNVVATYIRLKPGASAARVQAGLPDFVARAIQPLINRAAPDEHVRYVLSLKPLTAIHLQPADQGDLKPGADVKVLAGIAIIGGLIVVVAAINFVTLMTARASRRAVEVGVRKAVGAERKHLIAQFMGEALVYVTFALVLAIALAELLLPVVNAALQRKIAFDYLGEPALLIAMIGVAAATAVLAGIYPALVLSSFRPASVLKGGPIATSGGGRVRQVLVVAQFAVLVVLVLSTLTIYRQTVFALKDATHTNKDDVVMLFAAPCSNALRDAVSALPGVRAAACASPFAVGFANSRDNVEVGGRRITLAAAPVDFGFFELYGLHPLAGRLFDPRRPGDDGAGLTDRAPPLVINEAAVRALGYASPQAALGHFVNWHFGATAANNYAPPPRPSEIVGVVPDFTFGSVRQAVQASFFFVGDKTNVVNSVVLNIKLEPGRELTTLRAIDAVWKQISGGLPVQRYFADQFMLRLYIDTVIQGAFIAVCALIAVSIACLGLFALSAYTAERRTKEIGVRKAMGASSGDILKLLLWQFTQPVLLACLIAWPIAWLAMNWWLQGFAYRVDQAPWTFLASGAAAVVIALATVLAHAWRVSRAKPVGALRYE